MKGSLSVGHNDDSRSIASSKSTNTRGTNQGVLNNMLNLVAPDRRSLMRTHLKTLYKLGITNDKGVPNPNMLFACKVLKIELEDLEPKTLDDFL